MYHEHPFKIVKHAIKNIWLLIIPLLRAVRSATLDFDAFRNWITGVWFDILIIIAMIAFGYIRWLFTWYRPGRHHIRLRTGIFIHVDTVIAYERISAVTEEHSFWLRPFKAAKIRIKTRAKTLSSGDMSLTVRDEHIPVIYNRIPGVEALSAITPQKKKHGHIKSRHVMLRKRMIKRRRLRKFDLRPKWYAMIFYSLAFSSSLSGIIYIGALIFNAGRIVSEPAKQNMDNVYRFANDVSENVSEKIPMDIPPVILISLFILLGTWLISFASNLLRYSRFSIKKTRSSLRVISGVLTKRIFHIIPEKINYIDLRQNLLMKIFRVNSININCSGYGTSKFEPPVILPILQQSKVNSLLGRLGIEKELCNREIKPEKWAFWSYISIPSYILSLMLTADYITAKIFPNIAHIIMFAAMMEVIPMIWFIIVKIDAFFTTGITFREGYCCIRYSRFLVFHTLLVDKDRIVKMQIFQDAIDEKIDRCRLDLYFTSEKPRANKIKGLNIKDAKYIISMFEQAVKE